MCLYVGDDRGRLVALISNFFVCDIWAGVLFTIIIVRTVVKESLLGWAAKID